MASSKNDSGSYPSKRPVIIAANLPGVPCGWVTRGCRGPDGYFCAIRKNWIPPARRMARPQSRAASSSLRVLTRLALREDRLDVDLAVGGDQHEHLVAREQAGVAAGEDHPVLAQHGHDGGVAREVE